MNKQLLINYSQKGSALIQVIIAGTVLTLAGTYLLQKNNTSSKRHALNKTYQAQSTVGQLLETTLSTASSCAQSFCNIMDYENTAEGISCHSSVTLPDQIGSNLRFSSSDLGKITINGAEYSVGDKYESLTINDFSIEVERTGSDKAIGELTLVLSAPQSETDGALSSTSTFILDFEVAGSPGQQKLVNCIFQSDLNENSCSLFDGTMSGIRCQDLTLRGSSQVHDSITGGTFKDSTFSHGTDEYGANKNLVITKGHFKNKVNMDSTGVITGGTLNNIEVKDNSTIVNTNLKDVTYLQGANNTGGPSFKWDWENYSLSEMKDFNYVGVILDEVDFYTGKDNFNTNTKFNFPKLIDTKGTGDEADDSDLFLKYVCENISVDYDLENPTTQPETAQFCYLKVVQ